jgi:hypothetical protein
LARNLGNLVKSSINLANRDATLVHVIIQSNVRFTPATNDYVPQSRLLQRKGTEEFAAGALQFRFDVIKVEHREHG